MKNEKIAEGLIKKGFVGQQCDEDLVPIVDLKTGDKLLLKEDGIYFERKLNFAVYPPDHIKEYHDWLKRSFDHLLDIGNREED